MRFLLPLVSAFFVVAASSALATVYPKSAPEKAFSELKVYDPQGHPWRAAREDWDGARQRVAQDPAWAKWLTDERTAVDSWTKNHHDRVEWVAGWSHDGVSPKDGSKVTWVDKIPGEEVQFFTSPSDPHIEITPKLKAWWVVSFRDRNTEMMVRAARLFRLTGDKAYAAWVAGQMDFYATHYLEWEPTKDGARLFWQTLTEGSNLVNFTSAVRLLGDYATAAQLDAWRTKFFEPEVAVLNKNFQQIHNIATWQRCSVAQVALLFHDEAMWKDAIDGKFGLRAQMAEGVTSDYLWHEQSLGYNGFVVQATLTLFTTAGLYGRAGELAQEMNVAENLMLSPLYLRFPNGMLPNPADNVGLPRAPDRVLLADAAHVFPTTIGLREIAKRRDWQALLDPPEPAPRGKEQLPEVTSRNLETSRMALLKSGPWQVFFHYGQHTKSHSQSEALNYAASFNGTDITHDTGVVGYGSPLYKGYYTRGANHNVPLVDGEGEETPPEEGQLLSFSASPATVAASQPGYRKDARAQRSLAIDGNKLIDTASIETVDGQKKTLGLTLHVQGKVKLPASFQAAEKFADHRPEPFTRWRDVRGATFHDQADFDVVYSDGTVLHVTLTTPGEFRLWHGDTPDSPPRRRESFYLELTQPAAKAVFTTTFAPAR